MQTFSIFQLSNATRLDRLKSRFSAILFAAMCFVLIGASTCQAQQLTSGSSSRQFRTEGIAAIPFERLDQQTQAKLQPVIDKPSIYRRLPKMGIECDPDYFRFLVRYPEVIVEIWKLMDVTKMDVVRTGPWKIDSDDGAGTISDLELVYGDAEKHVFYGTGSYEGPLLRRKLTGRCVLVLQTQHGTDENGKSQAISQLDVYLKVDNMAAGMIARTLQPLVGPTADHNFMESLKFIQRLNETTVRNGAGVQMMGTRLTLQPEVLKGFQNVAAQTSQRASAAVATVPPPQTTRVTSKPEMRSFRSR